MEAFSLKDHLFNAPKIASLAESVHAVWPSFERQKFVEETVSAFPDLELKERIAHIRVCLRRHLPEDYREAVAILLRALPAPLDASLSDNDFGDFIYAPYSDFVAQYGCTEDHLDFSLNALREITQRFSAEDAIRYFINAFPEYTLKTLQTWAQDSNYHVRRWCSEGTRPRLPWSQKIQIPVSGPRPILEQLFADRTRYVTRSVANHLNDIAKTDPELVLELLTQWKASGRQSPVEMAYIQKHSLRTLVKNGHPQALAMLGFGNASNIRLTGLTFDRIVSIGSAINFSFSIESNENQKVVVDYIVWFQNKSGAANSKKVFKLQTIALNAGTPAQVSKKHLFKPGMTTRALFPGTHQIDIQVNGTVLESFQFELMPGASVTP